jgi:NAD(P)-dependent dehydrogenase (short-subunit alcohol dehydrogenase family)
MKTLRQLSNLEGRVAVVTGGAGHVGSAVTAALAELGAAVAILDLDESNCLTVANRIHEEFKVPTLSINIDLGIESQVRSVCKRVTESLGRLDIIVNCAALVGTSELKGWSSRFEQQDASTWRLAIEVNLTSVFVLIQSCTDVLRESGHGSIINIGSIYGLVGPDLGIYEHTEMGNPAAYAVSKGGLLQLTRWLATVLSPSIRVNAVTLGGISRNQPASFQERYAARTPLRRLGTEEEVKGAVAYLASDLSAYVTGHNLVVDGGWTIW